MPGIGILSIDIPVHTLLLHHEHFAARGQHGVDVECAKVGEWPPAPVEFGKWLGHRTFFRWDSATRASWEMKMLAGLSLQLCRARRALGTRTGAGYWKSWWYPLTQLSRS